MSQLTDHDKEALSIIDKCLALIRSWRINYGEEHPQFFALWDKIIAEIGSMSKQGQAEAEGHFD